MFIQFRKMSAQDPTISTPIIVNIEELLTIDFSNFENNGVIVNATHLEIGWFKYAFYTLSTITNIENALNVIDITGGYVPGDPCLGGNAAVIIAPSSSFPLIKVQAIFNNTLSETRDSIINPSKILYAEQVTFIDALTGNQVTGVQIVLTDMTRTRLITTLTYAEIFAILQPVVVA
jgi:hypothetical protein